MGHVAGGGLQEFWGDAKAIRGESVVPNYPTLNQTPVRLTLLLLTAAGSAVAEPISGQGTWENTLQSRDLNGDGTTDAYYDTVLDITWLADADLMTTLNYAGGGPANELGLGSNFVDDLAGFGHLGVITWRLPNEHNPNQGDSGSELAHLYEVTLGNTPVNAGNPAPRNTGPFSNLKPNSYLYPRIGSGSPGDFYVPTGYPMGGSGDYYAWPVAPGDAQASTVRPPNYELIDLGTLPDGGNSYATDINDTGQVVGYAYNKHGKTRAFRYQNGHLHGLGTMMPGNRGNSRAAGINNTGQIVGSADAETSLQNGLSMGFVWQAGTMRRLGPDPTSHDDIYVTAGTAINNAGAIAFNLGGGRTGGFGILHSDGWYSLSPQYLDNPFDNPFVDPELELDYSAQAVAITADERALASGLSMEVEGNTTTGFILTRSAFSGIGRSYSDPFGDSRSSRHTFHSVSDGGLFAGEDYDLSCSIVDCYPVQHYGFIKNGSDGLQENIRGAYKISLVNDNGLIVGWGTSRDDMDTYGFRRPLVKQIGGPSVFINKLADTSGWNWKTVTVTAMNENGDIVGHGQKETGEIRAFMLRSLGASSVVSIDILPGDPTNKVYPNKAGEFSVAILSGADFDATQVDPETISLGRSSAIPTQWPFMWQVDGAHGIDMTLLFNTEDVGILCNDTELTLHGETMTGEAITAIASIDASECDEGCHTY